MSLTTESDGSTVLTGPVTDQAALHGLLRGDRRDQHRRNEPDVDGPDAEDRLLGGVFYLLTFAASIPALVLKGPVLDDPEYVLGSGPVTGVLVAGLLDVVTALTGIGTAVVLYRVTRRYSESAALGSSPPASSRRRRSSSA